MATPQRSKRAPSNYSNTNSQSSAVFTKTYIGFVKENSDPLKMGRLNVWIPELSSNPGNGTYWCNYMSPFAGASNISETSSSDPAGQTSYGWWSVPPDLENEVVVMFINGDPNRAIWIGCLYQQYMNSMVPGIPNSDYINPTDPNKPGNGPATEYNKKDPNQNTSTDPKRPPFKALEDALTRQGLYYDHIRGPSTSGARRDNQPQVFGFLSPKGNQMVIDDADENAFIRFRTRNGTQIMISDDVGSIYMISKNGNSWMEISDAGIDVYSSGPTSIRSQNDINFHADHNFNVFAVNNINMNAANEINFGAGTSVNTVAGNQFNVNSNGSLNLVTGAAANIGAGGDLGINTGGQLALQGYGSVGITSCGDIKQAASKIMLNSGVGPTPAAPANAKSIAINPIPDRELSLDQGYPDILTKTNVSRLPTHEPFTGHATSSTASTTAGINMKVSQRVEQGDSGVVPPAQANDVSADATDDQANTTPSGNPNDWWIPTTGIISAVFGEHGRVVHQTGHDGCDIAAPHGTNIMASRSGKVIFAQEGYKGSGYNNYGKVVSIDHGDGYISLCGHMSYIGVNRGDKVVQGQSIGRVGRTGHSTGDHCHFEIRQGGKKIGAQTFIPALGKHGGHVVAGNPNPTTSSPKKSNPSVS